MRLRPSISRESLKSPGSTRVARGGNILASTAFDRELDAGVADEVLQLLVLRRVHVLGFLQFLFGALHRGFDGVLVNLLLGDGVLGEDADLVAVDLGETAADREQRGDGALGDPEFAVLDLREQRDVTGENADLALDRRDDDAVYRIRVYFRFGRDDFEGEWHGWKRAEGLKS